MKKIIDIINMENLDVLVVCANGDYGDNLKKSKTILKECIGDYKYNLTSVNPERPSFLLYDAHIQEYFGDEKMRQKIGKKYDVILFQNCMTCAPYVGSLSIFYYHDAIPQIFDFLKDGGKFINNKRCYYDGRGDDVKTLLVGFDLEKTIGVQNDTYDVWKKKESQKFGMGNDNIIKKIDNFCKSINTKKEREEFVSLPLQIRELFSKYSKEISKKSIDGNTDIAKKISEIYKNVLKIEYEDYTDNSILVRGPDTKNKKEMLKSMKGVWNTVLGGWVFSKNQEEQVKKFIAKMEEKYVWKNQSFYTGAIEKKSEKELVEIMAKASIKAKEDSNDSLLFTEIFSTVEKWLRDRKIKNPTGEIMEKIKKRISEIIHEEKSEPKARKSRKYEENVFQKKDTPPEDDPLYIFYTTLAEEKPDSTLAIQWMVEHGVNYEENVDKYKELKKQKKLIKMT